MRAREAFGYRDDPTVPGFDDTRPIFVFDGTCALCSGGAALLMRHDRAGKVRFVSAQSPLGRALYAHYALPIDESYLLIDRGRLHIKTDGYLRLVAILGGAWHLLRAGAIVPRPLRDAAYRLIATNRYRWFGKVEQCALLTPDQRARLLRAEPSGFVAAGEQHRARDERADA